MKRIKTILDECQITTYLIKEVHEETVELFFIKQALDTRRMKDITKYEITVYRDFVKEDTKMRGSATAYLFGSMTDEEMKAQITQAYFSAGFVNNPYYPLPKGTVGKNTQTLPKTTLAEDAKYMAEALFKEDHDEMAWINSAELFATSRQIHIVSSEGGDVCYMTRTVEGEYITQCQKPKDVELYHSFYYETLDADHLMAQVKKALAHTKERANAQAVIPKGKCPVILSDNAVNELLHYYVTQSSAKMIYPKYSTYKVGEKVQAANITGDALTITLKAEVPYTSEAVAKSDHPLLEQGVLKTIHGESRLAYYLNTPAIGNFSEIEVLPGSMTLEQMYAGPYLHIITFSDFQIDPTTSHFGGEIRLALYNDGTKTIPITGGSLSAKLKDQAGHMYLSTTTEKMKDYDGPEAVYFPDIVLG